MTPYIGRLYSVTRWSNSTDCTYDQIFTDDSCNSTFYLDLSDSESCTVTNTADYDLDIPEVRERMEDLPHQSREGRSEVDEPEDPPPREKCGNAINNDTLVEV